MYKATAYASIMTTTKKFLTDEISSLTIVKMATIDRAPSKITGTAGSWVFSKLVLLGLDDEDVDAEHIFFRPAL